MCTSIVYRAQEKSWMDRNVFIDWYKYVFIPSRKKINPDLEAKQIHLNLRQCISTSFVYRVERNRSPIFFEMSLKEVENWIDKYQLLNSNNNKDSDEESPNFPPPSLDEVLPSILQIRCWSRGNKIVTVEENRSLDSLMEKMLQLKINIL
ncbi:hypothetical protein NQ318_007702 [Aromia moschata]|uniref:Uncharacterized protein n=1 Tax=Aromia moschata TaxID=1265417 RepID=A0AAV8XRP6_9CUCU|nr:hypothetical protein NQ318_007702 [Aromia moschata]